ncbi:MAG: CehA/McbA family metallohydrolase [Balneolaceae bacterium]|nr:CehA/McbA family metallohydrolase [Balneolaceae bacterium]
MSKYKIQSAFIFFTILASIFGESKEKDSIKQSFESIQTIEIKGVVYPEDQHTYRLEPFFVPEGIGAIEIDFDYTGKNEFSEMEIGLFDPNGFRGTSRFSKRSFYVSEIRATASYFPGPIINGEWNISLGFPTIQKQSDYKIKIRLIPENHPEFTGPSEVSLNESKKWYSGDFHTHTGHSDGFGCEDMDRNRAPCQVYQVVEAAKKNGLDFLSITDHNTVSHHQDMKVIQPIFSDLLLIRGQEVTTFYGHTNVYGTSIPIDFRIGYKGRTFEEIQREVEKTGAMLSINHPGRETGPSCTGCGWSAEHTNYDKLETIEIVNGTNIENDIAGIPFWHKLLNKGFKITGIGGSDDHSAGFGNSKPGIPTTVVYANSLSEKSILESVKKGEVYLRTRGPNGPEVLFQAILKGKTWSMGDTINLKDLKDQPLEILVQYSHSSKQQVEFIFNGEIINLDTKDKYDNDHIYTLLGELSNPSKGWLRFNLRDNKGITVVSNPIYLK